MAIEALKLPGGRELRFDRPCIVGVLNVTPDSFSDGGCFSDVDSAVAQAVQMVNDGADIIDVGGESSRPGANRVDADEQWRRVGPVIKRLTDAVDVPISIDTTCAKVAEAALDAGGEIVNDISAGCDDDVMIRLVAERGVPYIIMHMRGKPTNMQNNPEYQDVVGQVRDFLLQRAECVAEAGLTQSQIILDPGIGFGKTTEHNLQLLAGLDRFTETGFPVMLGASRKRFIGEISCIDDAKQRDAGTGATTAIGVMAGVGLFRVHNIRQNRQSADVAFAVRRYLAD